MTTKQHPIAWKYTGIRGGKQNCGKQTTNAAANIIKKLTMSRQHKSGGARFIPAINKSECGSSCVKVWGESTENWNPDKVLLLLLGELLKKIKIGKVKRAPATINELGVKRKHEVYEWNSCCWPAVSAAMSLKQTAALLAAALPSCDGRREVVTHLHPFVGAAVRAGLVPEVQIQHTHARTR